MKQRSQDTGYLMKRPLKQLDCTQYETHLIPVRERSDDVRGDKLLRRGSANAPIKPYPTQT